METGIYVRVVTLQINQAGQTLIHKGLSFLFGGNKAAQAPISMA